MKTAQAASDNEIKPTLQQIYINKFARKLKSVEKDTETSSKKKSSKPWWMYPYPAKQKKLPEHLMPQKILQQQEKFINKQIMSQTLPLINNQNMGLSPDIEIIKITTVVEAIRQKRQNTARMLEAANSIQKIIGKKRSKRSFFGLGDNSTATENWRHDRWGKSFVSNKNKKTRHPKPNYRKQQTRTLPKKKRLRNEHATDRKEANDSAEANERKEANDRKETTDREETTDAAIPSTVFYKRIWEYINGTRPHSDITSGYRASINNFEKDNSTCIDKDEIIASQSNQYKSQTTSPTIKPKRGSRKRIWNVVNATQSNGSAKVRSKRDASIPKSYKASSLLCGREGDKQAQATNKKTLSGITDINSSEISNPDPYTAGFWAVANKTKWQQKRIPILNIAKLNNDSTLSSLVNSASEVDDLNKIPDKVEPVDHSSLDNSTGNTNEARNSSQEVITESGPSYSSKESFATSSFSSTESALDKPLLEKDQMERAENYSTSTTSDYDPSNIPYVEVPDYSDQKEDSLDKNNRSANPTKYKEDSDSNDDYNPKWLHDDDDFSSKSPSAKVAHTESEISSNANNSNCTESEDSAECVVKYDVELNKLSNNTDNVYRSANNSAESLPLSEDNKNTDFVDFEEYKKPFNWDEFFKDDPILENIRTTSATFSKYDNKENPDHTEEVETYATDPKKQSLSYNSFTKNEDPYGNYASDGGNVKEETDSYAKKEAKQSGTIDKGYYPYGDKNFFKYDFGRGSDKESKYGFKKNPDRIEKNGDYYIEINHSTDREGETDSYAKQGEKESDVTDDDYDNKKFFEHVFGKDNDKESSDTISTENEFLNRYFTKDVLRQLRDNSTDEEDRQREESRNKEDIRKTLSRILHKKDRFSRLDENLNKMIEKGEAIPIKYNNVWNLEYESPRKRNEDKEEETEKAQKNKRRKT